MFTHRLTGSEVEHDILDSNPDLAPVDMLTEYAAYQRLADGSPVVGVLPPFDAAMLAARGVPPDVVGDLGALLLPPGYLRGKGLGEGDVIALRVTADGLLLEAVPDGAMSTEGLSGVGRRLTEVLAAGDGGPVSLDVAVWTACADNPTLFTEPLPPLGEALDACGLVLDDEWLAPPGFDFRRWRANARRVGIAERHDLGDDEALAVLATVTLYERVAELHAAASEADEEGGDAALAAFAAEMIGPPEPSPTSASASPRATVRSVLPALAEPAVARRSWLRRSVPVVRARRRWDCSPRRSSRFPRGPPVPRCGGCGAKPTNGSVTSLRPRPTTRPRSRWIRDSRRHWSTSPATPATVVTRPGDSLRCAA